MMAIRGGDMMNDDTRIFQLCTTDDREIAEFLMHFGRDLISWTHTCGATNSSRLVWHYVTARVSEHYGDFEDDMYVPFE